MFTCRCSGLVTGSPSKVIPHLQHTLLLIFPYLGALRLFPNQFTVSAPGSAGKTCAGLGPYPSTYPRQRPTQSAASQVTSKQTSMLSCLTVDADAYKNKIDDQVSVCVSGTTVNYSVFLEFHARVLQLPRIAVIRSTSP